MESLPNEIIALILSNLNEESLAVAMNLSKRFQQIIRGDLNLTKNLEYAVDLNFQGVLLYTFGYNGLEDAKHQNLFIENTALYSNLPDKVLQQVKKFEHIKKITFYNGVDDFVTNVLMNFDKLEEMIIAFNTSTKKFNDHEVDLKNIKILEIYECDHIPKFKSINNLKIIKILLLTIKLRENNNFNEVLKTSHSLKELSIATCFTIQFNFPVVSFQLEKLTLDTVIIEDVELLNFLQNQLFLNELTLIRTKRYLPRSIEYILTKMSLIHLEIGLYLIPDNLNCRQVCESLKSLVIRDILQNETNPYENLSKIANLLTICNNVESLGLFEWTDYEFAILQANLILKNLKTLKFSRTCSSRFDMPTIDFKTLEHIEIDKVDEMSLSPQVLCLLNFCKNLKTLKINELYFFHEGFLSAILTKCKNIEEIHLGIENDFTKSIEDLVKQSSLKFLSFKSKSYKNEIRKGLLYKSPKFFEENKLKLSAGELKRNLEAIKEKSQKYKENARIVEYEK